MSTAVKNTLLFGCMMLCMSLASCQCSNPPPVGPVEDGQAALEQGASERPAAPRVALPAPDVA